MIRRCILILGVVLSTCTGILAQRFTSLNDQFPFARARCICQDNYGFLWFGTVDGLVKYDGISTHIYRNIPDDPLSVPGQEVLAIVELTDTTLLLGFQEAGLYRFNRNDGHCTQIALTDSVPVTVQCLVVGRDSVVWVGTADGLYAITDDQVSRVPDHQADHSGLLSSNILCLYEDHTGILWIGTRRGVHRLDRNSGRIDNPENNTSFSDQLIIDITEDPDGQLWVSQRLGPNRLYTWDAENSRFNIESRYVRDGEFRMDFDAEGAMWVSSRGRGIYRFENDTETFYDPSDAWQHGFWGLGVFDLLYDKYQNIWVLGEEVFQWSGDRKGFNALEGENSVIQSVFADDQYIWYSADDARRWNRKTGEVENFLEDVDMQELRNPVAINSQSRVNHFEPWGEDLVMSTTRNVIVWDRSSNRFTDIPSKAGGPLRDMVIDQSDHAWITVNQQLPMRVNLRQGTIERIEALRKASTSHSVALAADGTQWWGNRLQGLFAYNPETGKLIHFEYDPEQPETSISSNTIHDILCHSDRTVWVGTKFGLDAVDPQTFEVKRYPLHNDQFNTQITSILEGEKGTLWLGTKDGLLYLDPSVDSLRRFTRADGLVNTVYTERACYKDDHGTLYFGGDAGIDYFHPDQINANPVAPDLYIRAASVNNKPLTSAIAGECLKDLSLPYTENFIEIELIGLHFASPSSVQYSYRLPLQSPDWINLGSNRVITLARIPPGEYTLEAKCANADGVWCAPKQLIAIRIHPPFWRTTWFYVLSVLCIASITYLLYRFRVNQIRRAERVKAELSGRIAELEMKALRAQMNPHFLFNSLNSVRLLIDKGDNEDAKRYLTRYSQLIRQILNNSRKKFIRLDEELETLRLYLELEKMRFKDFSFSISVMQDVEMDFIEVPPLLLQPYVENALWHGLMNKQENDKHLLIDVRRDDGSIFVTIEDNGIGREQAAKLNSRRHLKKESLGLRISEDRLAFLRDLYGSDVSVEIIDLNNPTGTRVLIRLPVPEE